jgi:colicin import membrane protein
MTDNAPYSIPIEPGRWRAIALAATVHAALVAFLWIGIHWQSQVPIAVEAEVWSPEVREAAPPPPPPEPTPKPVAKPEPRPEPKPVIKEAPPPPKVVEPVLPNPEIALEKERKRKAQEQKQRDREEQARADKERQRKADEQERKEQEKKDAEKLAEKQKVAEAKQKALAEAKQKQKQEAEKKIAADKQRKADEAAADKRHSDDMKRLLGQASGSGASNSTGTAAQSQGPRADPGYGQRVGARIKNNINFNVPDDLAGNPSVEYEVDLLPDGSVASIHRIKSSGVSGFDEAVRRAIEKTAPYPKDPKSGSVPSSFIGIHKPKDQ